MAPPFLARLLLLAVLLSMTSRPGSLAQEATPQVGVAREVLIDEVVTGQPAGHALVSAGRWTFQPGPAVFTQSALDGPVLFAVVAGSIVATIGGTDQAVATGEKFVVPPGQDFALRNAGETEAIVVDVLLITTGMVEWSFDPLSIRLEDALDESTDALPVGPVHVLLEQWTLAPGGAAPAYVITEFDWFGVVEGHIDLRLEGERLPFRWESGDEREFGALQALPSIQPGTMATLRNAGDQPAVVYHLIITPADQGTPIATPAA